MEPIKKLPEQFTGRGEIKRFKFTLICMTEKGFCYEVTQSGIIPHYEVFLRKLNLRFACESYPTAKAFGIWAWTYKNRDEALNKLNKL